MNNWKDKAFSLLYGSNRFFCFCLSAAMSFIFYSSLAGSNLFFFWFNGIAGVVFDVKKIEAWDSGTKGGKFIACFFILFSIFAFAGSSLMETERNSVRTADIEYTTSLTGDITKLNSDIASQAVRVSNTPSGYGTAAEKEAGILKSMREDRDRKVELLRKYTEDHKSDESMSSFQAISDITKINVLFITWFFFIFRGVLLEIAVLYTGKKRPIIEKEVIKEVVKEVPVEVIKEVPVKAERFTPNDEDKKALEGWLSAWEQQAIVGKKVNALSVIDTLRRYMKSFEDYSKKVSS